MPKAAKAATRRPQGGKSAPNAKSATEEDLVGRFVAELQANRDALRYVALFLALCLIFYLLYYALLVSGSAAILWLREFTARVLGTIFALAGANVVVNGAFVTINGFGLEIIDECTAVFSSIVYAACLLAYPTTIRKKVIGIALGVPALYAINILRLVILAQVGISRPALFAFVHVYLWQASFIIFVVVIFILWLKFVVKE
ncbi:MAG TPA: exosortase H [Methanomicrobia archaeon]|nr:exosortase H [Methanomicrobia archaeon]